MHISILSNFAGDNEQDLDTSKQEDRDKVVDTFQKLLRSGAAIFMERADGTTLRVTGYDKETDRLIVKEPPKEGAEPPISDMKDEEPPLEVADAKQYHAFEPMADFPARCTTCGQNANNLAHEKDGRKRRRGARGARYTVPASGARVTAVAPRAGG